MKVYRGYNNEVGPISYAHWTYVTPDIEQAKYYATKNGEIEDGAIIEYDLDLDNLRFISLDKLNSFAQSESEIYSEEDLLWYQEGLGESLYKYIAGIYFTDPYNKDHTIYIVFSKDNLKNGRILSKEEFDAIQLKESAYENELNDILKRAGVQLNEREDLTKFNRIAGFYHLKTKKFDLFPRTSEDISVEDDEVNDYIHNVLSKDEFTEFNIVRFGIEDIPGEGVVCYIEGDTKRNVEKCYYAILEKYAEECDIIKYELEYYVGNEHKYIFLDRYGKQIMESLNESVENVDILKNPTSDELKRYNVDRWRLLQDIDGNYYFADAFKYTHDMMSNKLRSNGISAVDANTDNCGIILYNILTNTFYYRLLGIIDYEDVEAEYKSSYLLKEFPNAYLEQMYDDREELDESLAYAERSDDYYDDSEYQDMANVILKNPSRKELEKNGMIECRIVKDWNDNFYFANSYEMIHTDIVEKLESENIKSVETNLFYDTNSNTFYYNAGHLTDDEIEKYSEREEKYLRQSLYISKTFKDFHFKIIFGEL